MKKIIFSIGFIIILFFLIAESIFAGGGRRNGTGGATELLIPVGARGIAMGSSTLSNSYGLEALFWNPANIARVGEYSTNVMFSHMEHIADIGVQYGAVSTDIESFGSIALSIKSLSIGEIPVTTISNPDGTGAVFTPQFLTLGLTYARMLSDRISVGLTANLVTEKLDLVSATGIAFNVGVTYTNFADVPGLGIAFVMKNVGPQMQFDGSGLLIPAETPSLNRPGQFYKVEAASFELPSQLEIGASYSYIVNEQNALQFSGIFANNNFYGDELKAGFEYGYDKMFFIRAGYSFAYDLDSDYNTYGINAGVGLNYDLGGVLLRVDYAYRAVQYEGLGDNHIFSIGFGL
ncbi:MAG: PorV/PorQ family protein [Ignavibacterium sp.]|nr:PorV/PorQ family protein [Ignavibacterium sp.]